MKHHVCLWLLFLLEVAVLQNGVAQTSAPPGADVFASTLRDHRTWTDPALDISWTIPKGLYASSEHEEQWRKRISQDPQAVSTFTAELQKRDAEDRSHGILLRGDDADPQTLGLAENNQGDASGRFRMRNIFTPQGVSRTFMILAQPLPSPDRPVSDLLQAEITKLQAQDHSLKIDLAAEPESFGGIAFVHADWKRRDRLRNEDAYFRSYLASRRGYELILTFRAESRKALEAICRSMASISPAEALATK